MKTLIGLAMVANMNAVDFNAGETYKCSFDKSNETLLTLSIASKGMVMVNESMLLQQPDNERLYIGIGAGDGKRMMVFLHTDGSMTVAGEQLQPINLDCKLDILKK